MTQEYAVDLQEAFQTGLDMHQGSLCKSIKAQRKVRCSSLTLLLPCASLTHVQTVLQHSMLRAKYQCHLMSRECLSNERFRLTENPNLLQMLCCSQRKAASTLTMFARTCRRPRGCQASTVCCHWIAQCALQNLHALQTVQPYRWSSKAWNRCCREKVCSFMFHIQRDIDVERKVRKYL